MSGESSHTALKAICQVVNLPSSPAPQPRAFDGAGKTTQVCTFIRLAREVCASPRECGVQSSSMPRANRREGLALRIVLRTTFALRRKTSTVAFTTLWGALSLSYWHRRSLRSLDLPDEGAGGAGSSPPTAHAISAPPASGGRTPHCLETFWTDFGPSFPSSTLEGQEGDVAYHSCCVCRTARPAPEARQTTTRQNMTVVRSRATPIQG